jgi:hypothetical protein
MKLYLKKVFLLLAINTLIAIGACKKNGSGPLCHIYADSLIGAYYCGYYHDFDTGYYPNIKLMDTLVGFDTIKIYQSPFNTKVVLINKDSFILTFAYNGADEYSYMGNNDSGLTVKFLNNYDSIRYSYDFTDFADSGYLFRYYYTGHKVY